MRQKIFAIFLCFQRLIWRNKVNSYFWETTTYLFYPVKTMGSDDLTTQGVTLVLKQIVKIYRVKHNK